MSSPMSRQVVKQSFNSPINAGIGQLEPAVATTLAILSKASLTLVSYSNVWTSRRELEVRWTLSQKVTTAPHGGRATWIERTSSDSRDCERAIQSVLKFNLTR